MTSAVEKRRVLITGASGRLGKLLTTHFERQGGYDLVLLDRNTGGDSRILEADLSCFSSQWADAFSGIDVVIHLAGDPGRAWAPWTELVANNVDATLNVFRAADANNVRRVVYGSTLQTMEGYRFGEGRIAGDAPSRPVVRYAATKLISESIARFFAEDRNVSAICLRIGSVPGNNAETGRGWNSWRLSKWLSAADFCHAVERSILVKDIKFAVLTLVSNNENMRWDLSGTHEILQYEPTGGLPLRIPRLTIRIRSALARLRKQFFDKDWRQYRD